MVDDYGLLESFIINLGVPYQALICSDWLKEEGEDELATFIILLTLIKQFPAVPPSLAPFGSGSPDANRFKACKLVKEHGDRWFSIFPQLQNLMKEYGWKSPEQKAREKRQQEEFMKKHLANRR